MTVPSEPIRARPAVSRTYRVEGMTCGHCVSAVTEELAALDGVTTVSVDLASGGTSSVTVAGTRPLADDKVAVALDEAGGYRLAESAG